MVPERNLFDHIETRGNILGNLQPYPILVEFTKNPDEDSDTPIAQHLIGFLKVLTRVKLRYLGRIAMVLYPPLPTDVTEGNTRLYQLELERYAETCKLANFLGEVVGVAVHCLDLFKTEVPNHPGWYQRKVHWSREALFGQNGRPTKEWYNRQFANLDLFLIALKNSKMV